MTNHLAGKRVLIVEDEPLIADHLVYEMTAEGVVVIGPVASVDAALDLILNTHLDGAQFRNDVAYPPHGSLRIVNE